MNRDVVKTQVKVIENVVAWYTRRFWWVTAEDLTQECWVGLLSSDVELDDPADLPRYAAAICRRVCSNHCYRARVQVSPSRNATELSEVQTVSLDANHTTRLTLLNNEYRHPEQFDPEAYEANISRLKKTLRRRISMIPGVPSHLTAAAAAVLVDGMSAAEVATALKMDTKSVYRATATAKERIAADHVAVAAAKRLSFQRGFVQ